MTAILLSNLNLKTKELLLLILLIGSGENYTIKPVKITLVDLEKLDISFRATSSKIFKELEQLKIIEWDRKNHLITIRDEWIREQLRDVNNPRIEPFYQILVKQ